MKCKRQPQPELITVAIVNQLFEAQMIQSMLEQEGITVFLQDTITAQTYSNAMGGVKIQVPNSQAEEAHKILVDGKYIS